MKRSMQNVHGLCANQQDTLENRLISFVGFFCFYKLVAIWILSKDKHLNMMTNSSLVQCTTNRNTYIFTAWFSVYLLFLPVFLFVLYIGFNKWKKPRSSASGGLSHSDVFTLNMVAMEMISVTGACVACYGFFRSNIEVLMIGGNIVMISTVNGQVLFHSLTCVERYLAVVRPVTYLRLRGEGGVTVRNISVSFIWKTSILHSILGFVFHYSNVLNGMLFDGVSGLVASIIPLPLIVFCSACVLCVLIRPKPGEVGGRRKQIDQSKRATVYTIVAILGALLLRLTVQSVNYTLYLMFGSEVNACTLVLAYLWSALPSSLVLPLLFLHRAQKLPG